MFKFFYLTALLLISCVAFSADDTYHYSFDLTKVADRKMNVELIVPKLSEDKVVFSFPKIVPGTYSIYDFGRFVEDLKAFDQAGNPLSISRIDTNSWEIDNKADALSKITYRVMDTYHADRKSNPIFEPAGTDFESDTCFVLNLHTMLGYFRNHTKQPFELTISHKYNFYGSTSLVDHIITSTKDQFLIPSYNEAIDNPIMYTIPDTAHIRVGESDVLVSVFSPSHKANAKGIAGQLDTLLQAQGKYLGGKLPVKNYSFLIYLADHSGMTGGYGALEHSYSSMYYLIEGDNSTLAPVIRDVSAHEFFHIVTPLNIHSYEIADFDFDNPKMSQHLWLYEGSTEYHAHAVQVKYGLISQQEYLGVIKQKMSEAVFGFNDALSFTEMSKGCLDTFKDQYNNVYAKGMLISMCLDLKLLKLSDGKHGIMDLINELSKTYGKDKAFRDDELFDKIVSMTYPGIRTFFNDYVIAAKPLPFEEVLDYAGVNFARVKKTRTFTMGGPELGYNPATKRMKIVGIKSLNEFGQKLGYQVGDEIATINGKKVTIENFREVREKWLKKVKEGSNLSVKVYRPTGENQFKKVTLKAKAFKADTKTFNSIAFSTTPTPEQLKIREAWLKGK